MRSWLPAELYAVYFREVRTDMLFHCNIVLGSLRLAEASCTSQIKTARAVATEFSPVAAASGGVSAWASIHEKNSERDVQKVVKRQGTTLDVPITQLQIQEREVPWISPRSWLEFFMKHGLLYMLSGLLFEQRNSIRNVWSHFWTRYQLLHPHFGLFDYDYDLSRVIALYIHGDEGRTLKSQALMVTTIQSVLGVGFQEKRLKRSREEGRLHVNFAGHTFLTRYVVNTMHKNEYAKNPSFFHDMIDSVALDLEHLLHHGIVDKTTGKVWRFCVIGVKGDMPYLQKVGMLIRSWNTGVKRGETRTRPKGVCHLCLAGTLGVVAEDVSDRPGWFPTVGAQEPWLHRPPLLKHLPFDKDHPGSYFRADLWHCVHLGIGKSFISSAIILSLPVVPRSNNEDRFKWLTAHYKRWCKANHVTAFVARLTEYLVSLRDPSGTVGQWSKGSLTTQLMRWLPCVLGELRPDPHGFLPRCKLAAEGMNSAMSFLYQAPLFLEGDECTYVSGNGMRFLQEYASLARDLFNLKRPQLFPLFPKIHACHHAWYQIAEDHREHGFAQNPLSASCQMDEDAIGRVSRTSRRVSSRKTSMRTLQRYLISCKDVWKEAEVLR